MWCSNSGKKTGPAYSQRLILHVDADAFFVSVEQVLRPELAGRPVIVGGEDRGVVSSASYEARRFGVRSAMPIVHARRICPHAVFLPPNFEAYKAFSSRMFAIMGRYSPAVEVTSIDEGYVDLTGTLRLHGAPLWEVASRLLDEIRSTLGINASGGLAGSKTAAKMATNLAKPNGLLYLDPARSHLMLGRLPVGAMPGIGEKAQHVLEAHGISTVGDLAAAPLQLLRRLLGRWGPKAAEIASGKYGSPVFCDEGRAQKSYSMERTLDRDTTDYAAVRGLVRKLAEKVAAKLRADGKAAWTIGLKVRYADFTDVSRSMSLRRATNSNLEILACVEELFNKTISRRSPIRQVGVRISGIDEALFQDDLFRPYSGKGSDLDQVRDMIRGKFGFETVRVSGCTASGAVIPSPSKGPLLGSRLGFTCPEAKRPRA
ncbi:MAG: DNA polymerase IV [Desulfomonile sp.]|nr:DNA polymerase IV [Desulfomonile sp.]